MFESSPAMAIGVSDPTPFGLWPAVVFILLIAVLLGIAMVKAERGLSAARGSKLQRDKSERHAVSRLTVGMGRWGSGGGGGSGSA